MTTKEKLTQMLIDRGMSDIDANEVMGLAVTELDTVLSDYKITFNSKASDYPPMLLNLFFITVKEVALDWINKNCPDAWFKPMFEN